MSRWFRFYDGALDDPKVQALPPDLFKVWVNLLCVASRNDGRLPRANLPFMLRMDEKAVADALRRLSAAGLIDMTDGEPEPHNWRARQFKSDTSNERVKRHRQRKKADTCNDDVTLHGTAPETDTETDTPSGSNEPSGVSTREPSARQVFETILTPERAKALTDGRNRKKAAQTAHAAELVVAKLRAFADPNAAADLMILKGWTSIEPDWGERNGLRLAATVIPMAGTAPGVWITDDDPRWSECAARWQREKGRRPSANGSRHNAGIGHSFPADWPETKSQAEAAA